MSGRQSIKKQNGKGDKRVTIDAKHNEQLKKFKSQEKLIPNLQIRIRKLSGQIDEIEEKLSHISPRHNDFITHSNTKMELEDEIQELQKKITNIENQNDEIDYFLNAGPYVIQYFINKQNIGEGEILTSSKRNGCKKKPQDKNILDFFNQATKKKEEDIENTNKDKIQNKDKSKHVE